MSKRKRLKSDVRKEHIIDAAIQLSITDGYTNVTRADIATAVQCSESVISYHFGTMVKLKRAVMRHAVLNEVPHVIMQGLTANDPVALAVSEQLKEKCFWGCL